MRIAKLIPFKRGLTRTKLYIIIWRGCMAAIWPLDRHTLVAQCSGPSQRFLIWSFHKSKIPILSALVPTYHSMRRCLTSGQYQRKGGAPWRIFVPRLEAIRKDLVAARHRQKQLEHDHSSTVEMSLSLSDRRSTAMWRDQVPEQW